MYTTVMQKCLILAALCLTVAVSPGRAKADDKQDVLKVETAFEQAKLHNDVAALERLLANDFIEINQWGAIRDRRAILQLFKNFKTTSLVTSDVSVRLSGDTATLIGNMFESGKDRFMFLQTYVKRHGEWKLFSVVQTFRVNSETLKVVGSEGVHPITGRVWDERAGLSFPGFSSRERYAVFWNQP